jgi:2-dehydro-3-deoxyphosphooctonate aldolase (KDO 8-P synthase)
MILSEIPNIKNTNANNFFLLAGPCAIESEEMALRIAVYL